MVATQKIDVEKKVKTAILLRVMGPRGNDIYENFKLSDADKVDYEIFIKQIDEFCKP